VFAVKKIGLTLGKYAPLHKGHEYVIETMLREMDEAIVMIYDTTVTLIPLQIRADWIKKLYPDVKVVEAWDGPIGCSHDREYELQEEQYILSLLGRKEITAFYSSEYYGEHMSKALNCTNRRVDEARVTVPVSATMIRENPLQYRQYISDIVYRDLIIKVVFLGAMSTGKSTIAEALAKRYSTTFASEYGRDYWDEHQVDRRLSFEAFNEIAVGHIEREEVAFLSADRYCFVDTNAITTYMFALDYHGTAPELLTRLAVENASRYDLFFLCEDDIPYDDTWDRSGDQKRHIFHKKIITDLKARRIPYISLKGDLETRMKRVDEVLSKFQPYSSLSRLR
jgi:NadR type nicotinamide-nucleotide adenylyltransferase